MGEEGYCLIDVRPIKMKTENMIKIIFILSSIAIFSCSIQPNKTTPECTNCQSQNHLDSILTPISVIEAAYSNQDSGISVIVKGTITRILSDDTVGDRHQRFIITLSNNQTLLIAHNIDMAPRVAGITIGSLVYVHGDYIWNNQGGLVHWTHHDPEGTYENGWIVFGNTKYD
jgi:hypothetical protein